VGLIFTADNQVERLADRFTDDNSIDLSRFDEAFQQAQSREGEEPRSELPDGYYDTTVEEVRLSKTPRTGNPMVIWKLRVTAGEHEGRALTKTVVVTQKTVHFLKSDLERCGLHLEKLSDLAAHLVEMFGLRINVLKKTKDQWTDVYFVRVEHEQPDTMPF
jgi:hypothetical protein